MQIIVIQNENSSISQRSQAWVAVYNQCLELGMDVGGSNKSGLEDVQAFIGKLNANNIELKKRLLQNAREVRALGDKLIYG